MIARILTTLTLVSHPSIGVATDIQPQSGVWAGEVIFNSQTGCPPQMVAEMKQAREGYSGEPITFPKPFGPEAFKNVDPSFTWQKIAPNIWEGIYSDVQPTGLGTLTIFSKSIMVIIAPDQINQIADMTVDLPQGVAQSMGMAATTCLVRSNVYHKRTGP